MKKTITTKKSLQRLDFWLDFLWTMTEKEIKTRYKHALLGFLWIFLNPFLQMIVIGIVFQFFMPLSIDNYYLFLFAGLLPWNFFSFSASKAVPSIVFERALIQKAKFPRESIVLSIVLSNALHFCISLGLFLTLLLIINSWNLFSHLSNLNSMNLFSFSNLLHFIQNSSLQLLVLLFATIWLLVFTAGFSLLGASLNVKFRDVQFVIMALLPLWFYTTPIVYNLNLLPSDLYGIAYLNPMTGIIELFRWSLLSIPVTKPYFIGFSLLITLIITISGSYIFNKNSKFFDDWI